MMLESFVFIEFERKLQLYIFQLVFYILISGLFLSCEKEKITQDIDKDVKTKPTIKVVSKNIVTVSEYLCNAKFDNVLKVNTGTNLNIRFRFEGANELSQYKIDVHNNFDCHSHGKMAALNPWKVLKITELFGKEVEVNETLIVPPDASIGNYHLTIQLLDELGNEFPYLELF